MYNCPSSLNIIFEIFHLCSWKRKKWQQRFVSLVWVRLRKMFYQKQNVTALFSSPIKKRRNMDCIFFSLIRHMFIVLPTDKCTLSFVQDPWWPSSNSTLSKDLDLKLFFNCWIWHKYAQNIISQKWRSFYGRLKFVPLILLIKI